MLKEGVKNTKSVFIFGQVQTIIIGEIGCTITSYNY